VAFETEISNFITIGNAISAEMSPAFVNAAQFWPLVYKQVCPGNTNVVKFRKSGSLTAEAIAESAAYSFSANSELTDSSITATATKKMVANRLSVEAQRFAVDAGAEISRISAEMGRALARLFDADVKALSTGLSQLVTAGTVLTKDTLLDGLYNVMNGMKGGWSGKAVFVGDYKGINEIRKELSSISASAFANIEMLGMLAAPTPGNGYAGNFMGIDCYQTDGYAITGGDDRAMLFDPAYCFAAAVDALSGIRVEMVGPSTLNNMQTEIVAYTFWNVVEWNDAAGSEVRSDT